jgi:hypothetical protein
MFRSHSLLRRRPVVRRHALLLAFGLALLVAAGPAAAGDSVTLELRDGSRVSGELLHLGGGVAVVKSESLGRVEVKIDDVQQMQRTGKGSTAPNSASRINGTQRPVEKQLYQDQVNALQGAIASDPSAMATIEGLASDPLVLEILADEALMQKIQSGDLSALANDPRLQALSEHPTVRELNRSVNGAD